jgi:UDPglucose 6-dehydrogenase
MKVAVIGGTGYVGLVTGLGLAVHQNEVICADIDEKKIENLQNNILPIYEEGLEKLLEEAKRYKKIRFTTSIKDAVMESEVIIIAVGTPENRYGDPDMSYMLRALKSIANHMDKYKDRKSVV